MTLGELGLQNFQVTNERSTGASQAADLSESAAAVGGDTLERLMRRLGSMAGRVSVSRTKLYSAVVIASSPHPEFGSSRSEENADWSTI